MTAATAKTGLTRTAYNTAIAEKNKADQITAAEKSVSDYRAKKDGMVSLLQRTRALHVEFNGQSGATQLENAIGELEYSLRDVKRYFAQAEATLARLKGDAPVDNDDE